MLTISPGRRQTLGLAVLVALFLIYAAAYIYRSSFVIDGVRHYSLFDDGMISMRYARNLAAGDGLVWNRDGARVEGITNPLWTMMMSAVHLLPIDPRKTSLVVQIIGALLLACNVVYVYKLAGALCDDAVVKLGAAALTAFYLPLNTWGLQGMEVSALALIVTVSAWLSVRALHAGLFTIIPPLLLALGTLIRIDTAVPAIIFTLFMAHADREHRRNYLLIWSSIILGTLAAQTCARYWYYGDIFPNTYYLKMSGAKFHLRISRGLYVLIKFIITMNPLIFFLPFFLPPRRTEYGRWLLLALVSAQLAYSVYVGGDAWDWWGGSNRYIAIAIPCFFIALAIALARLSGLVLHGMASAYPRIMRYYRPGLLFLLITSFISLNSLESYKDLKQLVLVDEPLHRLDNLKNARLAYAIGRSTRSDATIAVTAAGVLPYLLDRPMIDLLGKSDARIAHEPSRIVAAGFPGILIDFFPGHRKWDYPYSIGELHPDVVVRVWDDPREARPYLDRDYILTGSEGSTFYVRRGSSRIAWDRVDTTRAKFLHPDTAGVVTRLGE